MAVAPRLIRPATDIRQQYDFAMIASPRHEQTAGLQEWS